MLLQDRAGVWVRRSDERPMSPWEAAEARVASLLRARAALLAPERL